MAAHTVISLFIQFNRPGSRVCLWYAPKEGFPMKVSDLMSRMVVSAHDEDSLLKVIHLLEEHQISGLPVLNDGGSLVGVISRADLCQEEVLKHLNTGNNLDSLPIKSIKHFDRIVSVHENDPVEHAAQAMSENKIHRVIVVNAVGDVIGVLTSFDLAKLKASDRQADYEHPDLTDFDKQFIRLLVLHRTEREMAAVFHISEADVYRHIHDIQEKLGVSKPSQIVARAFELQLF